MNTCQRLKAAWAALTGTPPTTNHQPPTTSPDPARELARLRLDLQARDEEIAKLRAEFTRQESQAATVTAAAGREALADLCRALAPTLSQLATLRHIAESGREVRATDALKLFGKVEQALVERGLERIGEVGVESPFDPALHQRMSGGDVRDGDRVRVRFVGYRFPNSAPIKALVSRVEDPSPTSGTLKEND